MRSRLWFFVSVIAAPLLVLVGCSASAPTSTPAPTATATAAPRVTATPVPPASPTAVPTATPVPRPTNTPAPAPSATSALAAKQELRTALSGEPAKIDPNQAAVTQEVTVAKQLFSGLLGLKDDLTVQAVASVGVPTVGNGISADGKTYTFKLRREVTWSDGQPVTAKDYVYSIKRLLSPELAARYASFYYSIVGAQAYNSSGKADAATKASLAGAVGIRAVDDLTLEIKLEHPEPSFLPKMALWPVYPLRQDVIEKLGDKWAEPGNLIGNGPFLLKEWVHQDHITLEANPRFWGKKPVLQTVVMKIVSDANAAMLAYRNNELDLVQVATGAEKSVLADPALSKEVLRYNELAITALFFNVSAKPVDNKLVRQAIATAIDRRAFVDKVRNGIGRPATSWVPPGMPGYDATLGSEYAFNPARAKQLLAQAGFPDGKGLPPVTFSFVDNAGNRVIAQFIQANLKDNLGLDIQLDGQDIRAFPAAVRAGKFQFILIGAGADYPDPEGLLSGFFSSDGGNNLSGYRNPTFDGVVKQAKTELDGARRLQLWAQAQKLVIDDAPIAPIFWRERLWLKKPSVLGLKYTSMDANIPGDFFWTEIAIGR